MAPFARNNGHLVILGLALTAALILAGIHVSHPVWHDEGLTWKIVQGESWSDVAHGAMTYKPMPPLYFLLTKAAFSRLGGEIGLRLVSFIAGLASVVLLFMLVSRWVGFAAGAAAAAFMSATPGLLFYFVDANPYSILLLAVLTSILALERALESNRKQDWLIYGLSLLCGLSIHSLFIFYAMAQWPIPFLRHFRRWQEIEDSGFLSAKLDPKPVFRFCVVLVPTFLLWFGWVAFYLSSGGYRRPPEIGRLFSLDTAYCLAGMIPGILTHGHWIQWVCFTILLCAGLVRIWKVARERIFEWLSIWILPVLMITVFVRLTSTFLGYRYGLGVFPITALIVAAGAGIPLKPAGLDSAKPSGFGRFAFPVVFAIYLLSGFFRLAFSGPDLFTYQDWRQASVYLNKAAGACDAVWFPNETIDFPLRFYGPPGPLSFDVRTSGKESADALRDLIGLGAWSDATRCRVWAVVPDFTNTVPWIEARTRSSYEGNPGKRMESVYSDLPKRSPYRLLPVREFKRVRIFLLERTR